MRTYLLPLPLLLVTACPAPEGCLGGADDCVVPSPCKAVAYTCESGTSEVFVVTDPAQVPGGVGALGALGDVVLGNDKVVAVIEALDHPHYLGPTGGNLVDLSNRGANDDDLRQLLQATGLLPQDVAHYDTLQILDDGDIKAVQVTGTLDNRPDVRVATRYEIRPCEPGIRVRTELIHEGVDPMSVFVGDGFYFGDRGQIPFAPAVGAGFTHPAFGLSDVGDAIVTTPYMVAAAHEQPGASYGEVACDREGVSGFHSDIISAIGTPTRVLLPRDAELYERFLAVAPGAAVSGVSDIALELRKQLWDEPFVTLTGRIVQEAGDVGSLGAPVRAQVVISEGAASDDPSTRTPWTHVIPAADGTFSARVPPDRTYTLEVEAFGQLVTSDDVKVGGGDATAADLTVPAVGELVVDGTVDGVTDHLLVFVDPTTADEADALMGTFLGHFASCAPLLGNPHGGSPACNRVLVDGPTSLVVPPGTYELYAAAGPFTTLAHTTVTVTAGASTSATLAVETLPLQPEGTLSGDFHVHGAPSFDSSLGGEDRVRAWLAARVDVIASTEHDVVGDYSAALGALDASSRLAVIEGTETTGHILFPLFSDSSYPRVIGHFNFWPVKYDPTDSLRGAPWDELVEPGALMDRLVGHGWDEGNGVAQLNHPYDGFQFGRDFGWVDAIDLDGTKPLPKSYDGSGASLFLRTPPGAAHANSDFDAEEVMNGSANSVYQPYRAIWFYLLNQGVLRAGTANSDSHTLTESVIGFPRNLVWADTSVADFDVGLFDASVRDGRMIGTNGPVLSVSLDDDTSAAHGPSLTPFQPDTSGALSIVVRAAPWIPVEEVRVVVNGRVVRTLRDELAHPASEDDLDGLDRLNMTLPLADLLPDSGDAWIVVEAGAPLVDSADLDCNGWPDTSDNNGDGHIDWTDVDALTDKPSVECLTDVGPLTAPPLPKRGELGYAYSVVVPGGAPMSYTNPLVLDLNGDGKFEVTP